MGDILSQNEIDQLLQALSTGEVDAQALNKEKSERKIRDHDFSRPSKFAKDHIRTLHFIHENYARFLTNFLSGYLRTLVQVDVQTVEALQYSEFTNSIANPAVLGVCEFHPMQGAIIYEMSPSIAYALIDRILGGKGGSVEKVRGFTEIEMAIIMRLMSQMLALMREPWENVERIRPSLDRIETNAQFAQLMSPNEMIALITFTARIGEVEGLINLCIPHMVLEPYMSKLSTKLWFTMVEVGSSEDSHQAIEARIEQTSVPVVGILGTARLSIRDFLMLQAGDVVPLDTHVEADLDVLVGELHKFRAKPGVRNKKVALKITEVRKEDE